MDRLFLCTDLDRTLLPNGRQPESPGARDRFARLVARKEVTLAYVSGRHPALVAEAIDDYALPTPDWVIADVGATILDVDTTGWHVWPQWEEDISLDWQGRCSTDLHALFVDLPQLRLQEDAKQRRFKLSYYLPLQCDHSVLQLQMNERLSRWNLEANFIFSIDEPAQTGLLDVLPPGASKLHAIEFLMEKGGFDASNTVFAGDSGNDLPVLFSEVPAVLVANADPDVRGRVEHANTGTLKTSCLYQARGDFLGMNGNYSAGILEGIAHFHPQTLDWLRDV